MALFPGLPESASARINPSRLYGAREDNRGRHTDNPAGRHSVQTKQQSTSIIPHFAPDVLPAATLPILSAMVKSLAILIKFSNMTDVQENYNSVWHVNMKSAAW